MAKKVLKANLSVESIKQLQKNIDEYKKTLQKKCELLVKKLAELGIKTAQENTGSYGKYITFTIKTEPKETGCKAIMIASNTGIITSEWRTSDGVKSADVSPLLMVEFGSGLKAENPKNIPGVGTGTFPGGTHGADPNGWWYMDLAGEWHHSYGVTPKMPIYKASIEIISNVRKVAKEVFG